MGAYDNTLGAALLGVNIAGILYGFTCVQTWYYFMHSSSDVWYIKSIVVAALISDTCHQSLILHAVYTYLVTYYGQPEALDKIIWSLAAEVFFNTSTAVIVQCFLVMRVWRLSNKSWLATGSVLILVVSGFFTSFTYAIKALRAKTFAELTHLRGLSMAVNVLSTAGDLLIALLLCYMLHVSRTGFRRSDTLINRLMVFSINTGLLTSFCAIASLISICAWPDAFIYIAFYFSIGRLYCNALLATLNSRKRLRSGSRDTEMSLSLQDHNAQQKMSPGGLEVPSERMPNSISIKIDTTEECIQDEWDSGTPTDMKRSAVV